MPSTDNGVADTIKQQLGGRRFEVMTGATGFLGDASSLMFSLPKCKDGINKVRITLEPSDTYKLEFMQICRSKGNFTVRTVAQTDDIYCDVLRETFTRYTGLYTSLRG